MCGVKMAVVACAIALVACGTSAERPPAEQPLDSVTASPAGWTSEPDRSDREVANAPGVSDSAREENGHVDRRQHVTAAAPARPPNELGRIPILEYHLIGGSEARWERSYSGFRADLELLYARGYRPITVAELVDGSIDLPAGLSPIIITFDDASPGQFRYIEQNGRLEVDPNSAVGIWLDFNRRHPDWGNKAVFCMLSGAEEGRSFFGDKGIEGQKTEWRLPKLRFLVAQGFELCNHTLWHANLAQYDDAKVQEQIARGVLAIDSAVAGYTVRTFALPLGRWPQNRELTRAGRWTEPRSGRTVAYRNDAILLVAGGPARSPHDSAFDPHSLPRVQVFADELVKLLDRMDRQKLRYVSDGNPDVVTRPIVEDSATAR